MAAELHSQDWWRADRAEEGQAQDIADKEDCEVAAGRPEQPEVLQPGPRILSVPCYNEMTSCTNGSAPEEGQSQGEKPPSKTQVKKLLKMQHMEEIKRLRKQEKKELRHQETLRKRGESAEHMAAISAEEREEVYRLKHIDREARRLERIAHKVRLDEAIAEGQNVVIDLEWESLMLPNEIKSLGQQVMYCYGANTRAAVPSRLTLAGCRGAIRERLENISGFDRWRLDRDERSYVDVFPDRRADLIYLTADSPHVVESLDRSKIYVIGGVVDRNRFKNCTLDKANGQGIATAKLPINEHMKLSSSQVLTVNQVVDILLGFLEHEDWPKALDQAIPLRKRVVDPAASPDGEGVASKGSTSAGRKGDAKNGECIEGEEGAEGELCYEKLLAGS